MLVAFIHGLEIALLSLLAALIFRVHNLYLAESTPGKENIDNVINRMLHGNTAHNEEYTTKMESLKKAQTFAGMQLIDIKRQYGDLDQKNLDWLREAVSLYLIGAIDLICKDSRCNIQMRKEIVMLVLKSNLNLSTEVAENYYHEALYRKQSSNNDLSVRAGAKAAKAWLTNNYTPKEMSLLTQLDEWGIFA